MTEQDKKDDALDDAQRKLAASVAASLDETVPPEVAARLRAARQEAVYIADRKSRAGAGLLRPLLPIGGVAAAGLAVLLVIREPAPQPMPALDDVEMAAAADMEFLDELEMLAWLDDEALDAG